MRGLVEQIGVALAEGRVAEGVAGGEQAAVGAAFVCPGAGGRSRDGCAGGRGAAEAVGEPGGDCAAVGGVVVHAEVDGLGGGEGEEVA